MKSNIYAHPAICATPELIWALQERLGMRAVVEGRCVRLVGEPRPTERQMIMVDFGARPEDDSWAIGVATIGGNDGDLD